MFMHIILFTHKGGADRSHTWYRSPSDLACSCHYYKGQETHFSQRLLSVFNIPLCVQSACKFIYQLEVTYNSSRAWGIVSQFRLC